MLLACGVHHDNDGELEPSFETAERLVTENAALCHEAADMGAMQAAIDETLEEHWDAITASAYYAVVTTGPSPVTTTGVRRLFELGGRGFFVRVTPDSFHVVLGTDTVFWLTEGGLQIQHNDAEMHWSAVDKSDFDIMVASTSFSAWSCMSPGASARAEAYAQADRLFAEGDGFYFEGGTESTKAHIDLTEYRGNYHVGYCEPIGCGVDRGFESTVARLTGATVGSATTLQPEVPAFRVSPSSLNIPAKATALLLELRALAETP